MRFRHSHLHLVLFFACLVFVPGTLLAQQPISTGSASAYGLGAMTEARLSEAALWNPALAGIFDGPMSSFTLLQFELEAGNPTPLYALARLGQRFGGGSVLVVDSRTRSFLGDLRSDDVLTRLRAGGVIHWLGLHSRDVLISLSSRAALDFRIPVVVLDVITGPDRMFDLPEYDPHLLEQASVRTLSTTLAVAKGSDLGRIPYLGRTWAGVTAKATLVHEHALGGFRFGDGIAMATDSEGRPLDSSALVLNNEIGVLYNEISLRDTRVYGVDAGIVFSPWAPVLISASVANLLQVATLSPALNDLYGRTIGFAGRDSLDNGRAFVHEGVLDLWASNRPWYTDGEYLARATHFTPIFRGAMSIDTRQGRFLIGIGFPLERAYSLDRAALDEYSVGWQSLSSPARPRLVYTRRLDGTSGVLYGTQRGYCSDRLAWSAGWFRRSWGEHTFSVSLGWSRGRAPCGQFR